VEEKNRISRRSGGENRLVRGEKMLCRGKKCAIYPYLESKMAIFA
jgi:hypothetical protein